MCYDCGCEDPNDKHGDDRHIVEENFKQAAEAEGIPVEKAKQNVANLIKKLANKGDQGELGEKEEEKPQAA